MLIFSVAFQFYCMCCQIEHSPGTLSISSKPLYLSKEATSLVEREKACSFWWSTLTGFHNLCTHHLMLNPEISPPFSNSFALISKWRNATGFKVLPRTTELPHCIFLLRMQGKNHRWSQRAASEMSCSQLPQAYLTADTNNLLLSRKDYSAFTLQSHTTLPVSSFVCPLIRCLLTVHHSHHRKRSQS